MQHGAAMGRDQHQRLRRAIEWACASRRAATPVQNSWQSGWCWKSTWWVDGLRTGRLSPGLPIFDKHHRTITGV
jgi:hypothetical protein